MGNLSGFLIFGYIYFIIVITLSLSIIIGFLINIIKGSTFLAFSTLKKPLFMLTSFAFIFGYGLILFMTFANAENLLIYLLSPLIVGAYTAFVTFISSTFGLLIGFLFGMIITTIFSTVASFIRK